LVLEKNEQKKKTPSSTLSIYGIINFSLPSLNPVSDMHLSSSESEGNRQSSISWKGLNIQQWCRIRF